MPFEADGNLAAPGGASFNSIRAIALSNSSVAIGFVGWMGGEGSDSAPRQELLLCRIDGSHVF